MMVNLEKRIKCPMTEKERAWMHAHALCVCVCTDTCIHIRNGNTNSYLKKQKNETLPFAT